jgi:hypothetical protein
MLISPARQDPDDTPRRHWSLRRAALPLFDPTRAPPAPGGCWEGVQLAAAEAALSAARQANSPIEAWEAASLIMRWGFGVGGGVGCAHRVGGGGRLISGVGWKVGVKDVESR